MCSVVTNLVTSLEFQPIRCATMLCHFGRTRNGYVATRFILLSSTVESSATSGYVVFPERFGQNEARVGRKVERTRKKPSFLPSSGFNRCKMSIRSVSRAGWGGGLGTPCIKIGYSKPTRSESREWSPTLTESFR